MLISKIFKIFQLWLLNFFKTRVDLRFFAELITIGILNGKEPLSLLGNQLTILTRHDEDHANIAIISSFCKNCGEDFADLVPAKFAQMSLSHNIPIPSNTVFSAERQKAVRHLFREYFRTLSQHIVDENKEIQKQERANKKTYQTKGELNSERKDKYDQALQSFKKLTENAEIFAEMLNEQMPELPLDEARKEEDMVNIDIYTPGGRGEEFDSNTSPWEDEETRQFYESIPDLRVLVPSILYKDSGVAVVKEVAEDGKKEVGSPSKVVDEVDEMARMEREIQEMENEVAEEVGEQVLAEIDEKDGEDEILGKGLFQ